MTGPDRWPQAAAIPYRVTDAGPEVLLVTSISSGRWILPKGNVDAGHTPAQAAEIEAREEAGVLGRVDPDPIAVYDYAKNSVPIRMEVFPLRVERVLEDWLESGLRKRRWISPAGAMNLVGDSNIRATLEKFVEFLDRPD